MTTSKRTPGPRTGTFWHLEQDPRTGAPVKVLRDEAGKWADAPSEPGVELVSPSAAAGTFSDVNSQRDSRYLLERVLAYDVFQSTLWGMWNDGDVPVNAQANETPSPKDDAWVKSVVAQATLDPNFQKFEDISDLTESSAELDDVNDLSYALMQDAIITVGRIGSAGGDVRPAVDESVYLTLPAGAETSVVQRVKLTQVSGEETLIIAEQRIDFSHGVPAGADKAAWLKENGDRIIDDLRNELHVTPSADNTTWDEDGRIWMSAQPIRHFGPLTTELAVARALHETPLLELFDIDEEPIEI
ncbi:hypothetical protein [Leifsonia sp. Leaf264]|uniref:hypothetical protein n=1 Tax=Leifsonia sp. Leaf264 TaxID=1736314 RepID=UPI0006FF3309|nr:hypothetical protein [Leifsonia sp. Leaf264]KQO98643.1 hypothetical protein ASF30_11310 [Leifsonia sp. Leaf264]